MDLSTQNRGQHRETLPTGTDLADNYDRGTVSSKDEFDDELDEMKKNREIPYPVLKLKIGLRVDRPLTCFVNVKTCADKVSTFIDHTETLDYAGNGDEFFKREVEVMYYVGIDERQILVFEIHDGDKYHHRSGYLWASVSIPVAIMLSNQDHVPIYRGDDVLGYLLFGVEIIEKQKLVSLMDEDALGLRFFKSTRPTRADILDLYQTIPEHVPQFKLSVTTSKIVPKSVPRSKDDAFCTILRLCITDKLNGPTSKKATVLWQSNPNYKSPFDFVDIDVTIDESHILKLQSNTLKKSKSFGELRLVWQVCTRNKDTIDDNDFELLSYSTIKYSTFRSAAKKAMVWNEANEGHKKDYLGMMHGQDDMPKQITKYFYTPKEKRERDNFGKLVKNNQDNRFGGIAHMLNDAMNLENIQHQLTDMNSKFNDAMKLENIENQISRLSVDISAGALNQINKINHLSNDALSQIHDLDISKLDLDLNHVMDDVNDVMNKNLNDVMHGKIKLNIFNLKEDSGDGFEEELKGVCATVKVDEETGIDSTTRDTNNSVITIDDIAFDSDVEDRETPDNGYIQFSPLLVIQTHHIGPGEETFDRIVDDMLKQRIDDWLVAVKPIFSDALSDQKQTVLRSINILNAIKSGVRINPSFVVDVNPLCSMSLMQHSSVNDNSGSVKIDSNMLKALDVVYNFLYYFSNTNRIQAFAGGEVLPPTKEHPMHSCCRRVGIPLCQEYLINAEREGLLNNTFRKKRNSKAGALPHEDVAKCSTIFSMSSKSEIYNYLDKNKDLIHRMQKPVEDPESWGGGDYSTNHVVDTYDTFIGGVEEASMLYEPVNRKCDALADPGLLTASDRQAAGVGAEMVDNASDNLQRKTVKQNLDTCYAGSSEVPSGDEFWDILKKLDFISSAEFSSYDLDTVEVLLANSQKNAGKKDIPIVIWIISQPPNEEMVKRAENLFYRQCIGDFDNTKLIVLLVAEVRYDIYKYTQSDLISVGAQFDALKLAYERADNASIEHLRNIMRKRHKPSQVEREEGLNYINQRSERHNKSRDDPTKRVSGNLHVGTNDNMMLFHWISWPEVVAKAITSEKNDISTTRGHKGQSNQSNAEDADNRENSKLNHAGISQFPKLATVQKVLEELFPVYAARRIVDIDEFDSTSDEQIQNNDHRNHHDSVNTLARDSVRRDSAMGVRTSIAGFFGDGIGRRFSHGMLQMLSIKGRNDKNDEAQTDKDKAKGQKSQKALSAYRFSKYSSLRRHKLLKHIKGYSHLMELKKRFEKEKSMLAINYLRIFLSDAIDAVKKDEEIQNNADMKLWGALSPLICSASGTASDSSGCIVA